ncbi:Uncharacterized protein PBTT_03178 [Plasmodiophora brassicae]|uniref:Uncharacterized protein n=1 Tax=Plasmodiophora brassicae TaxID=37360 RepID=A0A0G4ING3_PLABS|nr:hypothetical protein PBRA_005331 [Plasmodiophora brassicae]SPQ95388.1 unnamed protein product [Plasmodiophora brassicae]
MCPGLLMSPSGSSRRPVRRRFPKSKPTEGVGVPGARWRHRASGALASIGLGGCVVAAMASAIAIEQYADGWVVSREMVVLLYTVAGALASGLGCLPLVLLPRMDRRMQGLAGGVTAGAMFMASIDMLAEGAACNVPAAATTCLVCMVLGAVAVAIINAFVHWMDLSVENLKGADHRKAIIIILVLTLHSFAEGLGIGVSFSEEAHRGLGRYIAIAIALHNVAEGAIVGLSLVPRGESPHRAAGFAIISSIPQPIVALPCFALVQDFSALLPAGLGIAAGAMLFLVFFEIAPDALKWTSWTEFTLCALASAASMASLRIFIGNLDTVALS